MLLIWQMMVAMLHSNGQLRTEKDGDTEKGCQNLYSIRLLMIMIDDNCITRAFAVLVLSVQK